MVAKATALLEERERVRAVFDPVQLAVFR